MRGAIPPFPQHGFMEWCLFKHPEQLYLLPFLIIMSKNEYFAYCLFNNISSYNCTVYIVRRDRVLMNDGLRRIWKWSWPTFKILSQYLLC
jgi:hypothetical protein